MRLVIGYRDLAAGGFGIGDAVEVEAGAGRVVIQWVGEEPDLFSERQRAE